MKELMTSAETRFIAPFSVDLDLERGLMHHAKNHLVRRASDMRGYYADEAALNRLIEDQNNPVHYEVFEVPVPESYGHLMYCISALQPGAVNGECFMTKGHYHERLNTGEIYLCLRGEGLMLMKTGDGKFASEPMARGRMVYVPPYWAHRSVNTGSDLLASYCVYPAEAGHNYGDIAAQGFPKRAFFRSGKCVLE
jgi:glucose-6-phosphate isomerase, archaeal